MKKIKKIKQKKCKTDWQEEILEKQIQRKKKREKGKVRIDNSPQGGYKSTSSSPVAQIGDIYLTDNKRLAKERANAQESPSYMKARAGFRKSVEENKDQIDEETLEQARKDYKVFPPNMVIQKHNLKNKLGNLYKWDVERDENDKIKNYAFASPLQALSNPQHADADRIVCEEGIQFKGVTTTFSMNKREIRNAFNILKFNEDIENASKTKKAVNRIIESLQDNLSPDTVEELKSDETEAQLFNIEQGNHYYFKQVEFPENWIKPFLKIEDFLREHNELKNGRDGVITNKIRGNYSNGKRSKAVKLQKLLKHLKTLRKAYFYPVELHGKILGNGENSHDRGEHPLTEDEGLFTIYEPYLFHLYDYAKQDVEILILHAEADEKWTEIMTENWQKYRSRRKKLENLNLQIINNERDKTFTNFPTPEPPETEFFDVTEEVDVPPVTADLYQIYRKHNGGFSKEGLSLNNEQNYAQKWKEFLPFARNLTKNQNFLWCTYKELRGNLDYKIPENHSFHIGMEEGFNIKVSQFNHLIMPSTPRPNPNELMVKYTRLYREIPENINWDSKQSSIQVLDEIRNRTEKGNIPAGYKENPEEHIEESQRLDKIHEIRVERKQRQAVHRLRNLRGKLGQNKKVIVGGHVGDKIKDRFNGITWKGQIQELLAETVENQIWNGKDPRNRYNPKILTRLGTYWQTFDYNPNQNHFQVNKTGLTEDEKKELDKLALKRNDGKLQKTKLYHHRFTVGNDTEIRERCEENPKIEGKRSGNKHYWKLK